MGHGPVLLSTEANDRCGSTAVHPYPVGNRQQGVGTCRSRYRPGSAQLGGLRTFAPDFCAQILRLARLRVQSVVGVAPLRYDRRAVQTGEPMTAQGDEGPVALC